MIEASDFGVKGAISADGKIQADFIEGVPDILIEGNVNLGNLEIDLPALAPAPTPAPAPAPASALAPAPAPAPTPAPAPAPIII